MIRGLVFEIYNPNEFMKEHEIESKEDAAEGTADEELEELPVRRVSHVKKILLSIFSNQSAISQFKWIAFAKILHFYISNNFKGAIFEYKVVLLCGVKDNEQFPDMFSDGPLSETFPITRMKILNGPDGFMVYD